MKAGLTEIVSKALSLVATLVFLSNVARADELQISCDGKQFQFDPSEMTDRAATVRTFTPWHKDIRNYKCLLVSDLLERCETKENKIEIKSLNDYNIIENYSIFTRNNAYLCFELDNKPIDIESKGPYLILFNWQNDKSLLTDFITALSVWYVSDISLIDSTAGVEAGSN